MNECSLPIWFYNSFPSLLERFYAIKYIFIFYKKRQVITVHKLPISLLKFCVEYIMVFQINENCQLMFVYDVTFVHKSHDRQPTDHCSNSTGGKVAK